MEAAPTDLRLPALGLLWIPLQQSLLVRVGMGVLGVAATDAFVLIWRAVLLLGILGGMLWGGSSADRPYVRAIGLAAHALWPLLLAASDGSAAPITSAVAAAIGASAVLLDSGMGVRAGITLLIGLAFHPFGDLIAFAHGQLGTCSAHFIACLLYGAVAVPRAAWSRLRGDLVVLVGCLGVIVALMPLCSLGASPRADLCAADGYRLLERLETPYSGWLSVVDDGDARTLRTTHALVGAVVRATGVPMDRPTLMLSAVQWREGRAGDRDVLLLRLGSGALAELFMLAGWTVNVAEPDPAAMYIAQTYFNMSFSPALIPRDPVEYFTPQKQQEEGEQQQREPAKDGPPMSAYDAILVRAITPAGNLDARIAYDDVILDSIRRALRPHGILALHIFGNAETGRLVLAHLSKVFRNVVAYGAEDAAAATYQDLVIYASDDALRWRAPQTDEHSNILNQVFSHRIDLSGGLPEGPVDVLEWEAARSAAAAYAVKTASHSWLWRWC